MIGANSLSFLENLLEIQKPLKLQFFIIKQVSVDRQISIYLFDYSFFLGFSKALMCSRDISTSRINWRILYNTIHTTHDKNDIQKLRSYLHRMHFPSSSFSPKADFCWAWSVSHEVRPNKTSDKKVQIPYIEAYPRRIGIGSFQNTISTTRKRILRTNDLQNSGRGIESNKINARGKGKRIFTATDQGPIIPRV